MFGYFGGYFYGNIEEKASIVYSLQTVKNYQQESPAVAGKLHNAVIKVDMNRNLQRHRVVLYAIGRLFCLLTMFLFC